MSNIYVGDAAEGVIGLPQRFCEAKDLWEKEEQASKPCPDLRRGWRNLPCTAALVGGIAS